MKDLLTDFSPTDITSAGLENIVAAMLKPYIQTPIEKIDYVEDGPVVTLENKYKIEIEYDWNDLILV